MDFLKVGIKGKFIGVLVFSILVLSGLMSYEIYSLNDSAKNISHEAEKEHQLVMSVAKTALLQKSQIQSWKNLLLRGQDTEHFKKYDSQIQEYSTQIEAAVEEIKKGIDPHQIPFAENYLTQHKDLTKGYNTARDQFLKNKDFKYREADMAVNGKDQPVMDALTAMTDLMNVNMEQATEDSLVSAYNRSLYLFGFGVGMSALLLGFGYYMSRKIANQMSMITEAVSAAGEQVFSASEQLQDSSHKLSKATQDQASAIEETSASLTEISGMADSNSKGADEAHAATAEVYKISEGTRKSMIHLTSAMDAILESNKKIENLVKTIEEIGAKTEVIDDIVFKTQLLSFNASVEAERAGEHGRGFSVVAQEVGNLAQTSGNAAKEISQIVKTAIKDAVAAAAENKEKVSTGSELASETKVQMENVLKKLAEIQNSVEKIVSASREQGQGINQITNAMNDLSRVTQDNASVSEESASASSELDGQAGSLMQLVAEMRAVVTGKHEETRNNGKVSSIGAAYDEESPKTEVGSFKQTA